MVVSGGSLTFLIDFAEKELQDVFVEFTACLKTLDGLEPDCRSMDIVQNCASAASRMLGSSRSLLRSFSRLFDLSRMSDVRSRNKERKVNDIFKTRSLHSICCVFC